MLKIYTINMKEMTKTTQGFIANKPTKEIKWML